MIEYRMILHRLGTSLLSLFALLPLLAGCLPAAPGSGVPLVAVINAPADGRLGGLAPAFERQAEALGTPGFDFVRDNLVRFQELRRDFFGSRADASAARLARSVGAEVALMLGAPAFERRVTPASATSSDRRLVETSLRVEAVLIDAATAARLGTLRSREYRASRVESGNQPLPDPQNDPDLIALGDLALTDITPALVAMLDATLSAVPGGEAFEIDLTR